MSPPSTPALTSTTSNSSYSPRMGTSHTSSPAKRQKLVKDAAVFVKGEVNADVNYPPLEPNDDAIILSPRLHDELIQQHRRFKLYPTGSEKDGLIKDFVRRIPFSTEKKEFFSNTGFEGFDVFQYTFVVPNDPGKKEHTVMWDYNTGLVRITPFFKACMHSKTTPAKSLNTNPGLKEISLSVTGGALAAQGYWLPYHCARAICLTFAYPIRWVLTPIFGPSFIRECLQPSHPGFAGFKIDGEIVRCARLTLEGRKNEGPSSERSQGQGNGEDIPRSVPDGRSQSQKARRPVFKAGSPFDSEPSEDSFSSRDESYMTSTALNSPAISPKTTTFNAATSAGWTSINRSAPSSPPQNTPYHSVDSSLPTGTRRPNPATDSATSSGKRPLRHSSDEDTSTYSPTSSSGSECGGEDGTARHILRPTTRRRHGARVSPYATASASSREGRPAQPKLKRSKKYTTEDFRVARLLMELSESG